MLHHRIQSRRLCSLCSLDNTLMPLSPQRFKRNYLIAAHLAWLHSPGSQPRKGDRANSLRYWLLHSHRLLTVLIHLLHKKYSPNNYSIFIQQLNRTSNTLLHLLFTTEIVVLQIPEPLADLSYLIHKMAPEQQVIRWSDSH